MSASPSDLSHEKHLRNRTTYAKQQCTKKEEQVEELLLVKQCKMKEYQREQDVANKHMKIKLEDKLAATEASGSKVAASLTGRVTRLSKALVNQKEKVKIIKKTSKINLAQLKDVMKTTLESKDNEIRDLTKNYESDKVSAVERVRRHGKKRANFSGSSTRMNCPQKTMSIILKTMSILLH